MVKMRAVDSQLCNAKQAILWVYNQIAPIKQVINTVQSTKYSVFINNVIFHQLLDTPTNLNFHH